mmetsp:Transcript_56045/g.63404  ORF Transcript_56045/g.63404 Transcript_56045/m.63404 type:complete len:567 (-) Transcript_56045:3566-5266(-)
MSHASDLFFPLIATSAAVAVGGLVLLQTDRVSRKILNPSQLNTKRRGEYAYNWKKSVDKVKLQLDYCLAGGPQNYNDDPEIVMKNTVYISKEEDLDTLIEKITEKKNIEYRYFTLKIDKDPHDPTEELYLYIVREQQLRKTKSTTNTHRILYQLPLVKFGLKLAKKFEDQLTTTTLCFVADASSGKASSMLESLVKESKTGVATISEPFWMVQVARLAEARLLTLPKIKKIIFALSRLDAWSLRHEINPGDSKTVMITLPGQSVVATLLPLIQSIFPEDHHIFAYDGCVSSVQRGIYAEGIFKRSQLLPRLQLIIQGMCQDPVRLNNPLPSYTPLSHDVSLGGTGGRLEQALVHVPVEQARIVETWMSSVDAYFKLKQEESTNGYLPYCFKLSFLIGDPVGNFEYGTDSYWSLNSLLQYVTGCRTKAIPKGVMDAAKEWIKDFNQAQEVEQQQTDVSEYEREMIENCCFQHKQILIGNKTLLDTVLPKEHWTMKQASRAGCSCCGPDPYDEQIEEDEDETEESKSDDVRSKSFITGVSSATNVKGVSRNYVDGTVGFAFDPTRFSK